MEPGESIVGAYLRFVEGCDIVLHNVFAGEQSEIDVVGVKPEAKLTILCEVATHIQGLNYGHGNLDTLKRIEAKIQRARKFAEATFPNETHRYEVWSPIVSKGILTKGFQDLAAKYSDSELDVRFIVNEAYTERVQALVDIARQNASATGEPSFRLLQVLTRLRGSLTI